MAQSLITDEIQAWVGREATPWTIEVTALDVKRFAVASDDPNPLYYDEAIAKQSRYGSLIAPPLFYMAPLTDPVPESEMRPDGMPYEGRYPIPPTPLPRLMDGGTEIEFLSPFALVTGLPHEAKSPISIRKKGARAR